MFFRVKAFLLVLLAFVGALLAAPTDAHSFHTSGFVFPTMPPMPTFSFPTGSTSSPTPTPTRSMTPTPTVTNQVSPTPTRIATPTPTRAPSPTPTPTSVPVSGSVTLDSIQIYILNAINNYRASLNLYKVKADPYTCNFAKVRAQEISTSFNHDGFRNRVNNRTLPYPSYSKITENIAMTSNYQNVVNMWINSAGHAANMRADTPYVCVAKYGNYYAYEGWKP